MVRTLLKSLPVISLLGVGILASPAQEPNEEYSWDCPATGYLPFRGELLVSTGELAKLLEASDVTVVHVGFDAAAATSARRASYAEGHIPGARHWAWSGLRGSSDSLGSAEFRRSAIAGLGLSQDRRIVLYDTGIGCEAAAAYVALDAAGLADRAALLDGQWTKWVSEGRAISRRPPVVEPTAPFFRAGRVTVTSDEMERWLTFSLIDSRADASEPRPAALRMSWRDNLVSPSFPVMRRESDLRRVWSAVPARPDRWVVVLGNDWAEAAPDYFAARLLGYTVRILDDGLEWDESP